MFSLLGLAPQDKDYCIRSNFWKFYHIKTSFTLGELISLVKVFRLFRLERNFWVFRMWTQQVDVQHFIYWQGQCVCDALFNTNLKYNLICLYFNLTHFLFLVLAFVFLFWFLFFWCFRVIFRPILLSFVFVIFIPMTLGQQLNILKFS